MKKTFNRIGYLFKEPESRTKLLVFVLVGVVLSLSAILIQDPFWSDVLLQLAITFAAVALVQILWDFLGGDPLELKLEDQNRLLKLHVDLMDESIGIEQIWCRRSIWEADTKAGRETWHSWVSKADKVRILSNTFWNVWLKDPKFRAKFFRNLVSGAEIEVILYHPFFPALKLRAKDEESEHQEADEEKGTEIKEMQIEIYKSLSVFCNELKNLDPEIKKRFKLALTKDFLHFFQIIRADDRMLVALYLSGKGGSESPTLQLWGEDSELFKTYNSQFDTIWGRAKEIDENELQQLVDDLKARL